MCQYLAITEKLENIPLFHDQSVLEITLNSIAKTETRPQAAGNVNSVISKLIKLINSVPWQASKY